MQEADAYPELYQEGIGRMSKDGAITILQGRARGRHHPDQLDQQLPHPGTDLQHWAQVYGVKGHSAEDMAPWFEKNGAAPARGALGRCRRMPTTT